MNTNRRVKTGLGKLAPIFVEGQWTACAHSIYITLLSSPHFNMHTYIHIHPPFHYPTLLYIIHVAHPCIFPSCHPLPPHTVQAHVPLTHNLSCSLIPQSPNSHTHNYASLSTPCPTTHSPALFLGSNPAFSHLLYGNLKQPPFVVSPVFCCLVNAEHKPNNKTIGEAWERGYSHFASNGKLGIHRDLGIKVTHSHHPSCLFTFTSLPLTLSPHTAVGPH